VFDTATLALFAVASLAVYVMPGPDMLYIASRSIGDGTRTGMVAACGTTSGVLVHTLAAAFGLSAVFAYSPIAFQIVKWAGVAYLVYLGIKAWLERDADPRPAARETARPRPRRRRVYAQAAVINLLNPKIALFFLAFLPQFTDPMRGSVPIQMALLGLMFAGGGLLWTLFLAAAFGRASGWLARHPRLWAWQRRVSGTIMIALAANLAFGERR
jgi:threonine/homoserine/homoserine lactone efflux protein